MNNRFTYYACNYLIAFLIVFIDLNILGNSFDLVKFFYSLFFYFYLAKFLYWNFSGAEKLISVWTYKNGKYEQLLEIEHLTEERRKSLIKFFESIGGKVEVTYKLKL
jgi:hypothetical protein